MLASDMPVYTRGLHVCIGICALTSLDSIAFQKENREDGENTVMSEQLLNQDGKNGAGEAAVIPPTRKIGFSKIGSRATGLTSEEDCNKLKPSYKKK